VKKLAVLLLLPLSMMAKDLPIGKYLNMIAEGKSDEVRSVMLDLYVEHPNDPGVMLLAGAVLQDAFKAMDFYQRIVTEHPRSEWADDAMWRIVQFYAILGDEQRANAALEVMRQKYPTSQFLVPATDVVRSAVGLAAYQKENETRLPNLDLSETKTGAEKEEAFYEKPEKTFSKDYSDDIAKAENIDEQEFGKDDSSISEVKEPLRKKTAQELLKEQMEANSKGQKENAKENNTETLSSNDLEKPSSNEVIEKPKQNTPVTFGLQVGSFGSRDL
jgi:hypothetical protein